MPTQLKIDDFIKQPAVERCVSEVKSRKPVVSDVLDKYDNQYVNLVQKGGGVLGIALVGYVYVLEEAGIRFMKLAGTSAGAINTALLVVPGEKYKPKYPILLKALTELDLFRLVDGHPVARFLIKKFVKEPDFTARVKKWLLFAILILTGLLLGDFICIGWQHKNSGVSIATCTLFVLTGFYVLFLGVLGTYISSLFKRLKDSGFGINPGDFFYDWVKQQMASHDVNTVDELKEKANDHITELGLKMRQPRTESVADLHGEVVFISSELVTQNKFELPRMSNLFTLEKDHNTLQPAGFVRASMSIPIFFESYYIRDIPVDAKEIKDAWRDTFSVDTPPSIVRFVDGGMLSNFPINLFYNKNVEVPRLPTFGIDLDDTKPDDTNDDVQYWSLAGYLGRMFNTMRYYYDKDFLLKNRIMIKGIGKVKVDKFNWLNFFLTNKQKIDLFVTGAEAARDFLMTFDWEDYKKERRDYFNSEKNK